MAKLSFYLSQCLIYLLPYYVKCATCKREFISLCRVPGTQDFQPPDVAICPYCESVIRCNPDIVYWLDTPATASDASAINNANQRLNETRFAKVAAKQLKSAKRKERIRKALHLKNKNKLKRLLIIALIILGAAYLIYKGYRAGTTLRPT